MLKFFLVAEQNLNSLSTHMGINQRTKDFTQTQQQSPESPTVTLTWLARKYKVHELHLCMYILNVLAHINSCL